VPDRVETSIGGLHLNDGYPDDATTQKVYDNQTRSNVGCPAPALVSTE
jgi:hypothetical protein